MPDIVFVGDLMEANGKTIKQNNLEIKHNIPLGTLVEILGDPKYPDDNDGLRLFVVLCGRDCDGTPLYWLSHNKYAEREKVRTEREIENLVPGTEDCLLAILVLWAARGSIIGGFSEESLKVIAPAIFHSFPEDAYLIAEPARLGDNPGTQTGRTPSRGKA